MSAPPVLATVGLRRVFGALVAIDDVSLQVWPGARQALIGPNGAGKTTLVNLLTGVVPPSAGRVLLEGRDITTMASHARVHHGLVRTFQISQLFQDLTPLESVVGAIAEREGFAWSVWRPVLTHRDAIDEAAALLDQLHLADVQDDPTGTIGYGKQRLLEIAVALACRPRVLLLDEPAAGLSQEEREEVLGVIEALPREVSILLIEHDMDLVFRFAHRITVLVAGAILVEGPPEEIAADARVREAYLGAEEDA
jgi:ABC-type branched-subunit amino acid transport system ATPase component